MAIVVFYEKPGCINNSKQKHWLRKSGHEVIEKNLLEHDWCANELLEFFDGLPVSQWFNQSAPRIKSGELDPNSLSASKAVSLMLAEPLLIRRPLMQANGTCMVGFEQEVVDRWIGLSKTQQQDNLEQCTKSDKDPACPSL
jgi:nitrogenase-associated protein